MKSSQVRARGIHKVVVFAFQWIPPVDLAIHSFHSISSWSTLPIGVNEMDQGKAAGMVLVQRLTFPFPFVHQLIHDRKLEQEFNRGKEI